MKVSSGRRIGKFSPRRLKTAASWSRSTEASATFAPIRPYHPAGANDLTTGEHLVSTRRPGMDLVIAAHKSVAELGVIGRADHMHASMDAERDATLAYLDALTRDVDGRRGWAAVLTQRRGLIYAHTPRQLPARSPQPP